MNMMIIKKKIVVLDMKIAFFDKLYNVFKFNVVIWFAALLGTRPPCDHELFAVAKFANYLSVSIAH